MQNPFDKLIQDCADGKYTTVQIKSLQKAFLALQSWFEGDYMGKTGTKVNPEILVGTIATDYKLMANLLVFLKKYYIDPQYYLAPTLLYRVHALPNTYEPYVGQVIEFKSVGLMSSWTSKQNFRGLHIIGREERKNLTDVTLKAAIPQKQIVWSPACASLAAKTDYDIDDYDVDSYDERLEDLASYISDAGKAVFTSEREYIVINNRPINATVVKVNRRN